MNALSPPELVSRIVSSAAESSVTIPSAERPAYPLLPSLSNNDGTIGEGIDSEPLAGRVERFFASPSGACLLLGWLADEGCGPPRFCLGGGGTVLDFPPGSVFRHARADVETAIRAGAYDFGYVAFVRCPYRALLSGLVSFEAKTSAGGFESRAVPEFVSDKRLLDTLLEFVAGFQAHAGREIALNAFLTQAPGAAAIALFQTHVTTSLASQYVERFRPRPVKRSFITVLFGSAEPMLLQPVLFRNAGIDFGEWIYVCNSPEDAETVLRMGRLIAELYDVMITVITLGDNVGFGAANNIAIAQAASDTIVLVNPDVFPIKSYAAELNGSLDRDGLGSTLWGGLLFYDDANLMHSGMYLEEDTFIRKNALNGMQSAGVASVCTLLRVEHFDKGVPFLEERWTRPRPTAAVTGALMAFRRSFFEKLDGFSTTYIYGHYEDADLSLRWGDRVGNVAVHPGIRMVHLEGQGSKTQGGQYHGASLANRHFFSARHAAFFDAHRDTLSKSAGAKALGQGA